MDGTFGSCELENVGTEGSQGGGILSVAAGKTAYFFDGRQPATLVRSVTTKYDLASVALHSGQNKFVAGSSSDTWVHVFDFNTEEELGKRVFRNDFVRTLTLIVSNRDRQRPPWSGVDDHVLARREAVCNWQRGWHCQALEVYHRPIWSLEVALKIDNTREIGINDTPASILQIMRLSQRFCSNSQSETCCSNSFRLICFVFHASKILQAYPQSPAETLTPFGVTLRRHYPTSQYNAGCHGFGITCEKLVLPTLLHLWLCDTTCTLYFLNFLQNGLHPANLNCRPDLLLFARLFCPPSPTFDTLASQTAKRHNYGTTTPQPTSSTPTTTSTIPTLTHSNSQSLPPPQWVKLSQPRTGPAGTSPTSSCSKRTSTCLPQPSSNGQPATTTTRNKTTPTAPPSPHLYQRQRPR